MRSLEQADVISGRDRELLRELKHLILEGGYPLDASRCGTLIRVRPSYALSYEAHPYE